MAGSSFDWGYAMQKAATAHLQKVLEWHDVADEYGSDQAQAQLGEDPAWGPWDGCETCTIREVLAGAWDVIENYAQVAALGHSAKAAGE